MTLEILAGAVLGALLIALLQRLGGHVWTYAMPLALLPAIYVVFALVDGDGSAAGKEVLAGLPWIAASVALLAFQVPYATLVVGAFWLLHSVYDLVHDELFTNPGVPDWYPGMCFGVDVVVGAFLVWLSRAPSARTGTV